MAKENIQEIDVPHTILRYVVKYGNDWLDYITKDLFKVKGDYILKFYPNTNRVPSIYVKGVPDILINKSHNNPELIKWFGLLSKENVICNSYKEELSGKEKEALRTLDKINYEIRFQSTVSSHIIYGTPRKLVINKIREWYPHIILQGASDIFRANIMDVFKPILGYRRREIYKNKHFYGIKIKSPKDRDVRITDFKPNGFVSFIHNGQQVRMETPNAQPIFMTRLEFNYCRITAYVKNDGTMLCIEDCLEPRSIKLSHSPYLVKLLSKEFFNKKNTSINHVDIDNVLTIHRSLRLIDYINMDNINKIKSFLNSLGIINEGN